MARPFLGKIGLARFGLCLSWGQNGISTHPDPGGPLISPQQRPFALNTRHRALVGWALMPVLAVWQLNGFYLPVVGRGGTLLFWVVDGAQWIVLPAVLLGLLARKAALRPQHYGLAPPEKNFGPLVGRGFMVFVTAGLVFLVARNLSWRVFGPSPGSFQLTQFSLRAWRVWRCKFTQQSAPGWWRASFSSGCPGSGTRVQANGLQKYCSHSRYRRSLR